MGNKILREIKEFNVNWVDCDDVVSVTAYQKKMINQLKKLAESHPEDIKIVAENEDGTICVHLAKKYVRVSFSEPNKRVMTEEQRAAAAERLKLAREKKSNGVE